MKGLLKTAVVAFAMAYLAVWLDNRGKLPGAMPKAKDEPAGTGKTG